MHEQQGIKPHLPTRSPHRTPTASASASQSVALHVVLDNSSNPAVFKKPCLLLIPGQKKVSCAFHFLAKGAREAYFLHCSSGRLRVGCARRPVCIEQCSCQLLVELFELRIAFENGGITGGEHDIVARGCQQVG